MKTEQLNLLILRGAIAGLDEREQKHVKTIAEAIRHIVKENGDAGYLAITLVASEMTVEESDK